MDPGMLPIFTYLPPFYLLSPNLKLAKCTTINSIIKGPPRPVSPNFTNPGSGEDALELV